MPHDDPVRVVRAVRSTKALAPWLDGQATGTLMVAFSGGRDSTALLHALRHVEGAVAIHIDHGLQPRSACWARHCAQVAAEFNVAFETRRVSVAGYGNREHAARRARYAVWQELLGIGDLLALAHHADDQVETRLWQLLTGREPGGMPAERRLGAAGLVRPLLSIRRAAINRYAEHFGLRWIDDPSNAEGSLDRNYIRARIVPVIEERFPDALQRLARPRPKATSPAPLRLREASAGTIRRWLHAGGLPVARAAVAEIERQTSAAPDRTPRIEVAPGIRAWRYSGHWHLVREAVLRPAVELGAGCTLQTPAGTLSWRRGAHGLPLGLALTARRRVGGERIRSAGRGVTKSVKALFREARVPPWRRADWPLLYGDDGGLAAVAGLAVSTDVAVDGGWWPDWAPVPDFVAAQESVH